MQFFSLVAVMILFRALSQAEMGIWALFLAIVTIIEVGRTGLLQNALIKFLSNVNLKASKTKGDNNSNPQLYATISTASLHLNLLITILLVAALYFSARPIALYLETPPLEYLLKIHCTTTVALIPFLQFMFVQQANLEFRGIFWGTFVRQGSYFLYVVLFFVLGWKIELIHLVIVRTLGVVLGTIISYQFARPFVLLSRNVSWDWISKLFHYGKYVMGTNLSTMLYKGTDRLMIGKMLGEVSTAIFDAAIKVTNLAEAPTFSVATILFPQSARQMKDGPAAIKLLYEKAVGAILAILVPAIIFVLIFAEWIILIVAGEGYSEAANILRLTMFYGIFIPFAVQFGTVLDSTDRPKINFGFAIGSTFVNILFNYFFIKQFATIGAAYGTLCTYVLTFILMQLYLNRIFKIKAFNAFRYMFGFYRDLPKLLRRK